MQTYLNRVVVAGEIDSGKSTLIGRLLYELGSISQGVIEEISGVCKRLGSDFEFAYLLDSLEEERRGRLTIDTTQAFCKTKKGRAFIFIDVPGHQGLLKNMLCGSSYADLAILAVDVQKSIEQQTKRHAFILKFLGIEQLIVVLNKMDLIDFNENIFRKIKNEVVEFFKEIQLHPKYLIPISAKQGDLLLKNSRKMPWYKGLSLIEVLNNCSHKETDTVFRFLVQDIYSMDTDKVAVGKIISGEIKKGEKVNILPLDKERQVLAIKVFNKKKSVSCAPESIGLVLDDTNNIERGHIICKSRLLNVGREILAKIFCIRPFKINGSLKFRCLTQDAFARINQIVGVWDIANLEPKPKERILGETDLIEATIVTDRPVVVERFRGTNSLGRFVLEEDREICAVGIIP